MKRGFFLHLNVEILNPFLFITLFLQIETARILTDLLDIFVLDGETFLIHLHNFVAKMSSAVSFIFFDFKFL